MRNLVKSTFQYDNFAFTKITKDSKSEKSVSRTTVKRVSRTRETEQFRKSPSKLGAKHL